MENSIRQERKPIRVMHIITGLSLGGAETMLCKVAGAVKPAGVQSAVLALGGPGPLSDRLASLGIPATHLNLGKRWGTPAGILNAIREARKFNPDILDGWMYHGNLFAWFLRFFLSCRPALFWNIRQSFSSYGNEKWTTALIIWLGRFMSASPNRILYNSSASRRQHEDLGYRSVHAEVIPNGFDLGRFSPDREMGSRWRAEHGMRDSSFIIGLVARFHPMKDHRTFLRAAGLFLRDHPDAEFVLAGTGVDVGNEFFRSEPKPNGLGRALHLLGEQPDVLSLFRALDVLTLCSSHGEGFPNVVGEAMACEIPCVVTRVGDSAEIVGETGIAIEPGDPTALVTAWTRLKYLGVQGRAKLGEEGRNRVARLFGMSLVSEKFANLYMDPLGSGV